MGRSGPFKNANIKKSLGADQDTEETKESVPLKSEEKPLEDLETHSKGKELLERLKITEESIKPEAKEPEKDDDFNSMIIDGVEVVDVKIIPKDKGIPDIEGRKTWDKV